MIFNFLGFFGTHCERHLCSRSYCNDHGQCYIDRLETKLQMGPDFNNENIQFRCECDSNFTGDHCTIFTSSSLSNSTTHYNSQPQIPLAKSCKDLNCFNGGTCHQSSILHHPTCICAYGYTGFNCQIATLNRIDIKTTETKSLSHPSKPDVNNSTINKETHYDMMAYTAMIVIAIVIFGLFVLRLQNSVLKKMQRLVLI